MASSLPKDPKNRIAVLLRAKRRADGLSVNKAAVACGLNAGTISRLERALLPNLPDAKTLQKIAAWLGVPVSQLLGEGGNEKQGDLPAASTTEIMEVYLRADKNLDQDSAKALAEMFKILYANAVRSKK